VEILLSILIEWLSLNANMTIKEQPTIVIMTSQELDNRYGKPVHALYEQGKETIYLSDNIDLNTFQGASVLLHELVHHYQNLSGAMEEYSCIGELEVLAYATQKQYLLANGAKVMAELDPFNVFMRSFCEEIP